MNPTDFAQTYLRHEPDITRVLRSQRIYDEDRLHDTYIALYDHRPHPEPDDFLRAFIAFYHKQTGWQDCRESRCEPYDNTQLAALHIIDETDWPQRELSLRRLDRIIRYFSAHPQPDERDHKRACRILRLFLNGLSECEISYRLKISQPAVCQSLQRTTERLKLIARILYNRDPSQN